MNQLINELQTATDFTNNHKTLAARRRALGHNGRLATAVAVTVFLGTVRHNAGMAFLERIHSEVAAANPNWRKDDDAPKAQLTVKDLVPEIVLKKKAQAPALTEEYLTKLGVPATLASMSGKPTAEAMAKLNINPTEFEEAA